MLAESLSGFDPHPTREYAENREEILAQQKRIRDASSRAVALDMLVEPDAGSGPCLGAATDPKR